MKRLWAETFYRCALIGFFVSDAVVLTAATLFPAWGPVESIGITAAVNILVFALFGRKAS